MAITSVLMLQDRPDLARMVASWPDVDHALDGDDLFRDWSTLAAVPFSAVKANSTVLHRLGIVGDNGEVDATAMGVCQRMAIDLIQGKKKR